MFTYFIEKTWNGKSSKIRKDSKKPLAPLLLESCGFPKLWSVKVFGPSEPARLWMLLFFRKFYLVSLWKGSRRLHKRFRRVVAMHLWNRWAFFQERLLFFLAVLYVLKRIAHLPNNAELHLMLHLLKKLHFSVAMSLAEPCRTSIRKEWLHGKSL